MLRSLAWDGAGAIGGRAIPPRAWTSAYGLSCGVAAGVLAVRFGPSATLDARLAGKMAFLVILTTLMSFWVIRQERGYIKLSSIGTMAAAMLLPAPLALAVGATSGLASIRTRPFGIRYLRLALPMLWTTVACCLRVEWDSQTAHQLEFVGQVAVVATVTLLNWVMTGLALSLSQTESLGSVWRKTFSLFWVEQFGLLGVAALLVAGAMDGSPRGYGAAVLLGILSMALGESASEYRRRTLLEGHLSDTTRHLAYQRAADGLVHNMRNHLAAASGYIQEVAMSRQSAVNRRSLQIALSACRDGLVALDRMASASSPRIQRRLVDANLTVTSSSNLVSGKFSARRVSLMVETVSVPAWFEGDDDLMREVFVNLLLNALDAAPDGGFVRISVEAKRDTVGIRVTDNGSGIPEEMRDRLFEPHLTTKLNGSGMGLFTSYGVVREHRGKLVYSGSSHGAVFEVHLPLAASPVP